MASKATTTPAPKADMTPKADMAPKTVAPKIEAPKVEAPKIETPVVVTAPVAATVETPTLKTVVEDVKAVAADVATLGKTAVADAAAKGKTAAADVVEAGKEQAETLRVKAKDMMEKSMKTMSDVTEFTKGNVEAMVASAKAAAAGAETIGSMVVEHGKARFEETTSAVKSLSGVKTPTELFELNNRYVKTQFDHTVAFWSKMSETMLKVAGDVAQPLSSRMALAGEQVKGVFAR
ncbi:phasin family protein [Sandaracinobacteroides saxicola]|uniref:Phasin family protein n=1 Tax=Sandaracinobacteroides saxicola TaxID=2759707 RepID=A0A7G5IKL2_9SPHN|nr:phasin family protein [Sandaracinobacteroides saxicola]QMW23904.1 phasin family protein [Sandaracinobacteroides saxicola]